MAFKIMLLILVCYVKVTIYAAEVFWMYSVYLFILDCLYPCFQSFYLPTISVDDFYFALSLFTWKLLKSS